MIIASKFFIERLRDDADELFTDGFSHEIANGIMGL